MERNLIRGRQMLSVKHELTVKNFKNKGIEEWLNKEFFIQALEDHDRVVNGYNYFDHLIARMDEWGKKFRQHMPDTLDECFFYITGTNGYSYINLSGLAFQKIIWPEFFKGHLHVIARPAKVGRAMIGLKEILKYPCDICVYLMNDIKVNRLQYFSR